MLNSVQFNQTKNNIGFGSVKVLLDHTGSLNGKGSAAEQAFNSITEVIENKFKGTVIEKLENPHKSYPNLIGIVTSPIHWALEKKNNFDKQISQLFEGVDIFKGKTDQIANTEIKGLSETIKTAEKLNIKG